MPLIYCWFISSSYDFSLFSVFFPSQIYPSKLQHHWIKYHFVDLPSLKATNFYWFTYLFIWYLFHSNNWTRSRHGKNKCSAWPRVFALRMEYSLWTAIKYRKCFSHSWTPSSRRWCSWSLQMSLHFLMRWSRMLTSYQRYVCLLSFIILLLHVVIGNIQL